MTMAKSITTQSANPITQPAAADAIDSVIGIGDLAKLSADQRIAYYRNVCDSMGLNAASRPFEYIQLSGKLTLYARKDATDQLRKIHGVSITITNIDQSTPGRIIVSVRATDSTGRTDEDVGVVLIKDRGADDPSNALMKAITKAKRRVTLSICGLGWLDETEIETIPTAKRVNYDPETGELKSEAEQSADLRDRALSALEASCSSRERLEAWNARAKQYADSGALTIDDALVLSNAYATAIAELNASEA